MVQWFAQVCLYLLVGNNLNDLNPFSMSDNLSAGSIVGIVIAIIFFYAFVVVLAPVIHQRFTKVRTSNSSSTTIITGDFMAVLSLLMLLLFGSRQEQEKGPRTFRRCTLSKYKVKCSAPQETVVLHSQPHSAQLHIYHSGFTADHQLSSAHY